ncbi:tetratricopeptide repeat protein [Ekhidna sp.]|uniref:tetratricopeptide repeat protein n=1 Tax=Ekhidna sp. TaxID=2608089 RepID=UPI0032EDE459
MKRILFLLFVLNTFAGLAQNAIYGRSYSELSSFEDFQQANYAGVISMYKNNSSISEDERILLLLSELKSGKKNHVQIEDWLSTNDKHPIKPLVYFHLGEYFFYDQDYAKSRFYLKKVNSSDLTLRNGASYGFIYGVLRLEDKGYKDAAGLFQHAEKNGFEDEVKLTYYQAFTDYHLGKKEDAFKGFEQVVDSEEFGNSAKFFIAKMSLDKGDTEKVIDLAKGELSDDRSITNSGFHQLLGEAYAVKNDVAKADAYFDRAIKLHPDKPSAALYYQAGVSKFKIGNEDKAIDYLTEAGIQGGEYAQLSAFQLARLYLKKRNFERSLTAYIEASASDKVTIKKEALYQAAKINAQLGNFTESINYASDYLKAFKGGREAEEMQNLIAQSYLKTSNFDLAINHLRDAGIRNQTQREVYQKVTFQKALLSFNDASFSAAREWFNESLKFPLDDNIKNQCYYHLGELALRDGNFSDAVKQYQSQTVLDPLSHYGIGYAHYNSQNYQSAIKHFRSAEKSTHPEVKLDARVRLADCLYATKAYAEALQLYNQLSAQVNSHYLLFQKGLTLKNLDQDSEALSTFRKISSSEKYGAKATFQSAMIHFESANFQEAERLFSNVINNQPSDPLAGECLLNRGVCRKNLGELETAKADYEVILKNHITSDIALNAILGLQELQQLGVTINSLEKYIADYKQVNPESGSLELIEFEAAKRLYFDFAYDQAIKTLEKFIKDYPASGNKSEAKYYLADSYYRLNKLEEAKIHFNDLKYLRNTLTGRILDRLGDINKRLNNVNEASKAYQLLISLNLTPKDTYNAHYGLMQLYYLNERYADAISKADDIIALEWKPLNGEKEAQIVKARSYLHLNNPEQAEIHFSKLAEDSDVYAAEANYTIALIQFQRGQFDKSLDILFDLNSKFGSYQEWVDKSYLLIARNYNAKGDAFQAKATLRSIIQHSENQQVKDNAIALLNEIERVGAISDSTQNRE